ncbi:MAG: peptidylprolyl isomerase, partial [archaeon]
AVIGMEKDQEKEFTLKPEEAYGEYNKDLKKDIPREMLPKDQEPKKGMMLAMQTPDGRQIPAVIQEVTDKNITIDLNHPLAGKKLTFKIKVIDIKKAPEQKECECEDEECEAEECGDEGCNCK